MLKSVLQGYHYHPTLALRGALYYELFGTMLSRDECANLDLDWIADIALAQADLLFEAQ